MVKDRKIWIQPEVTGEWNTNSQHGAYVSTRKNTQTSLYVSAGLLAWMRNFKDIKIHLINLLWPSGVLTITVGITRANI